MRPSLRTRLAVSAAAVAALGLAGGVVTASPAQAASCGLRVDPPVKSPYTLLPPRVSDTARIICSAPVSKLELTVALYRNGGQIATGSGSNLRLSSITVTATGTCITGVYQAKAVGRVTHPGAPSLQTLVGQSVPVSIVC